MAISEAQKKASAKWDAENMTVVSCKMKKGLAARFAEAATATGTTRNAVLLKAAKNFVERYENGTQDNNDTNT